LTKLLVSNNGKDKIRYKRRCWYVWPYWVHYGSYCMVELRHRREAGKPKKLLMNWGLLLMLGS